MMSWAAPSRAVAVQRAILVGAMALATAASWMYVIGAVRHAPHHGGSVSAAVAMWVAMMLGMLLPAAGPMCVTYARVAMRDSRRVWLRIAAFVGAYVSLWIGLSALAAWAQHQTAAVSLWSDLPAPARSAASGALLIAAGAYQFSSLKHACLRHCRTPLGFLLTEWRPGVSGALRLGLLHGRDCIVCCWAMIALMFVVGTMNLLWMAALTLLMLTEKCAPGGHVVARLSGAAFLVWGVSQLI
jgi:predicted metal-binding membrane protein